MDAEWNVHHIQNSCTARAAGIESCSSCGETFLSPLETKADSVLDQNESVWRHKKEDRKWCWCISLFKLIKEVLMSTYPKIVQWSCFDRHRRVITGGFILLQTPPLLIAPLQLSPSARIHILISYRPTWLMHKNCCELLMSAGESRTVGCLFPQKLRTGHILTHCNLFYTFVFYCFRRHARIMCL